MSGGSWNYLCHRLDEAADELSGSDNPLRRALSEHMRKVAKAMHDIEWVDSSDYAPGDEDAAIRAVLGDRWPDLAKARAWDVMQKQVEEMTRKLDDG